MANPLSGGPSRVVRRRFTTNWHMLVLVLKLAGGAGASGCQIAAYLMPLRGVGNNC